MFTTSKNIIIQFIDMFYWPIFRKIMPLKTFRYAFCGGSNAAFNLIMFFIGNNFIFNNGVNGDLIYIGPLVLTHYIAAFVFALVFSFPIGFILNKFVVFQTSHLKSRVQLFRYALITVFSISLNYALLHFFVGFCGFWATPSQALTTVIIAVFSYFAQNFFTFRSKSIEAI